MQNIENTSGGKCTKIQILLQVILYFVIRQWFQIVKHTAYQIIDLIACLNNIFLLNLTFRSSTNCRQNCVITKYYILVFAAVHYCYEHCVKSVQIRSYLWSIFSWIQSKFRKIGTRNNSVFGHFSRSGSYVLFLFLLK